METDREKFVRLINARVPKAIKAIRLIGNLASKSNYKYESSDVRRIVDALEREIKSLRVRFETNSASGEVLFRIEK